MWCWVVWLTRPILNGETLIRCLSLVSSCPADFTLLRYNSACVCMVVLAFCYGKCQACLYIVEKLAKPFKAHLFYITLYRCHHLNCHLFVLSDLCCELYMIYVSCPCCSSAKCTETEQDSISLDTFLSIRESSGNADIF